MQIDKSLKLVVPVYAEDGKTITAYVHSTPLAAATVDSNFLLLSQTFAGIFNQGLGIGAGPAVAARLFRSIAENTKQWVTDEVPPQPGPGQMLLEEIRRLTLVIVQDGTGWIPLPLSVAVQQNKLSDEDRAEVENVIVFFIVVSATLPRSQRRVMLQDGAELFAARITSLSSTELAASLKTSTGDGSSGGKSHAAATVTSGSAAALVAGRPASVPR